MSFTTPITEAAPSDPGPPRPIWRPRGLVSGNSRRARRSLMTATRVAPSRIGPGKLASEQKRDSHRVEEARPDLVAVNRSDLVGGGRARRCYVQIARAVNEPQPRQARRLHAGEPVHPIEQLTVERHFARPVIAVQHGKDPGQHDVIPLETGIEPVQFLKAAEEKARSHEQDHGERHLRNDECPGLPAERSGTGPAAVFEHRVEVLFRTCQCR